jgi:hypothetical protein
LPDPLPPNNVPGKEYRICVSDTPSTLAGEVTDLLSKGWELHGPPFVQSPVTFNGNGTTSIVCQALVRFPANGTGTTTAQPPIKPRTTRPPVPATFRNVTAFLAVILSGYLVAECVFFRSGFYTRYLEPESSTGSFESTMKMEIARKPSGRKEVLVLGSSRMAEGFSAKLADQLKPEDGYKFLNCAVPSAGARVFYYMARDLDPHRNRYAAITVPIDDYDDPDDFEDVADRASELRLLINRLRFTDILPYTLSFTKWKTRREIFRGALFKGAVYQLDLADFIEHPTERLTRVKDFKQHGADWAYDYNGMDRTLAGMTIDWANRKVTFPPGVPDDLQRFLEGAFFSRPKQFARMRAFELRWLIPLVELYRNSKTKVIIFEAPRSPAPRPSSVHYPFTAAHELRKLPWVTVLDRKTFEGLEKPELFGDHVHLNSVGRKIFSPLLAAAVKEIVH